MVGHIWPELNGLHKRTLSNELNEQWAQTQWNVNEQYPFRFMVHSQCHQKNERKFETKIQRRRKKKKFSAKQKTNGYRCLMVNGSVWWILWRRAHRSTNQRARKVAKYQIQNHWSTNQYLCSILDENMPSIHRGEDSHPTFCLTYWFLCYVMFLGGKKYIFLASFIRE